MSGNKCSQMEHGSFLKMQQESKNVQKTTIPTNDGFVGQIQVDHQVYVSVPLATEQEALEEAYKLYRDTMDAMNAVYGEEKPQNSVVQELSELLQKLNRKPKFTFQPSNGAFICTLEVDEMRFESDARASKKQAKQDAAQKAFKFYDQVRM